MWGCLDNIGAEAEEQKHKETKAIFRSSNKKEISRTIMKRTRRRTFLETRFGSLVQSRKKKGLVQVLFKGIPKVPIPYFEVVLAHHKLVGKQRKHLKIDGTGKFSSEILRATPEFAQVADFLEARFPEDHINRQVFLLFAPPPPPPHFFAGIFDFVYRDLSG